MKSIKHSLKYCIGFSANNSKIISIFLLFCFALFLRIHHLDYESRWMDEIRQTSYYSHTFRQIIDDAASQTQPPLDYWIGHLVNFISTSDFAVRLPSALFGSAGVMMLVMIISQVCAWPVAFFFGIIAALMPFNLYYSQEARPYAIANFLFLCMFWALINFLNNRFEKKLVSMAGLLFFSIIFLYSRALSPLVVTVCLLLILMLRYAWLFKSAEIEAAEKKRLILLSCVTIILALIFYMPSLRIIIAESKRYVSDTSLGFNPDRLLSAVLNFNLTPIWQAYVVQSEPITYPLLVLVCLSPIFGRQSRHQRNRCIWVFTTLLLPMACILNLLIFRAKTGLPFRPAYVGYILPLVFILGATSWQGLWSLAAKARCASLIRTGILIVAAVIFMHTVTAAVDYKSMKRKPDWRGVSAFLAENYDSRHVLIFDSFSNYGQWEPTFFGFPLYYRGQSPLDAIGRIPTHARKMAASSYHPILILFQWQEYYLTPHSSYPILSVPTPDMQSIDYKKLCRDPLLSCSQFTGFLLIQLKDKSNNLAQDTYGIIKRLLQHYPRGSWTVELHLAAAALGKAINRDDWQYHLAQAENLVPPDQLDKLKNIAALIDPFRRP